MSNEIKMGDLSSGDVVNDADDLIANGYGVLAGFSGYKKECRYVAHATTNHAHLVEENKQLRKALQSAFDLLLISGWDDDYKNDINEITNLLEK